jgi:Zn-finger nucleic acid-binding protein
MQNVELDKSDITNGTENDLTVNEWDDTGSKWKRNCPNCGKQLVYKSEKTLGIMIAANTNCRQCSLKLSGERRTIPVDGMQRNKKGKWFRQCPYCNTNIEYATRQGCKIHMGKKCQKCFAEGQIKYLSELALSRRIIKTCLQCRTSFSVSPSKKRKNYCSLKCRYEAQRLGKYNSGLKGKGMSKEKLEMWRKYNKYKNQWSGDGFDYSLEEIRDLLSQGECFYCHRKEWLGLDRIDNFKGHTKDNTLVSCELCNMTRGRRFSVDEMKVIGAAIQSLNITDRRVSVQNNSTNLWKRQNGKSEI